MATTNNATTQKVTDLIKAFVENYDMETCSKLATIAKITCRQIVQGAGILANVTARAKSRDRLQAKLIKINSERKQPFENNEEIEAALFDLAGVRIALYFPSDEARVADLLKNPVKDLGWLAAPFQVVQTKEMNETKDGQTYQALHLRFKLNAGMLSPGDNPKLLSTVFEVQVASLLMNAWSEVNHDLCYKSLTGTVDSQELDQLRLLNQQVIEGQKTLNGLKALIDARSKKALPDGTALDSTFVLGASIRAFVSKKFPTFVMGPLDWLFYITRHFQINKVESSLNAIGNIDRVLNGWASATTQLSGPAVPSIITWFIIDSKRCAGPKLFEPDAYKLNPFNAAVAIEHSRLQPFLCPSANQRLAKNKSLNPIKVTRLILRDTLLNKYQIDNNTMLGIKKTTYYQKLEEANYFRFDIGTNEGNDQINNLNGLWDFIATRGSLSLVSLGIARAKMGVKFGYY